MIREWLTRARFLLTRRKPAELDEELQFHVQQSIDEKVAAGVTAEEAHRQALIDFGGIETARGQCHEERPGWWIDTVVQDVRYASRGFLRSPVFAVTVIATLAMGIGATTAVFSVVDRILFRGLPYAHDDQLVSIGLSQPLQRQEFTLGGFYYEWRDHQTPFSSLTFERGVSECNLSENRPMHLQCAAVAQNFLPTLGIPLALGRNFDPAEDQPHAPKVALLSYGLWSSRYHRDPGVLNQTIMIDDHPARILGVLPQEFEMPRLQQADIVVPAAMDVAAQHTVNSGIGVPMWAFARLKPGVTVRQAKEQMQPLFLHTQLWIPADFRNEFHLQVRSIRDRQMEETYLVAWVLLGAVLAVLLIAGANVASLFAARGAARQRDLAVRAALGASRLRLVRQALTEALLLASASAVAGCGLAQILLKIFIAIAPAGLPFLTRAHLDLRVIFFSLLLALLSAALFGILPALQKPSLQALAGRQAGTVARARMRRILVAVQIGISVVLLCAASLVLRSFRNLEGQNLGMQTRNVLTISVPLSEERYPSDQSHMDFDLRAEQALRRVPGVTAVAMSNSVPPDGWHDEMRYAELLIPGKPHTQPGVGGTVVVRSNTPGYFHVLRIPILQGRDFREQDRTSVGHLVVLSRQLALRLFPQGDAVGQHLQRALYAPYFTIDPNVLTVVGVAGDVKNQGLAGDVDPELYQLRTSHATDGWNGHNVFLLETELPPSAVIPWVRTQVAQLDATAPVDIDTLQQSVVKLADRPRFETALLTFFAACGLLLAIIGLYGVISYVATQRTQEIGVRMAVGATRFDILQLIATEGLRVIAAGGLAGLALAFMAAQVLRGLMFHVAPRDPGTYVGAVLFISVMAMAATLIPARAAMLVEPSQALRSE